MLFVSTVYLSSTPEHVWKKKKSNSSTIRTSALYALFRYKTDLPLLSIDCLKYFKGCLSDNDDNSNDDDVLMFRSSPVGGSSN